MYCELNLALMKLRILEVVFVLGIVGILSTSAIQHTNRPYGDTTSSPLDNRNCTACHSSEVITEEVLISANIPETGYVGGETYTVTIINPHPDTHKNGFEVGAETSTRKVGVWTPTSDNVQRLKIVNRPAQTAGHKNAGDYQSWDILWTAPSTGTGKVTFYAVVLASNGNNESSGDQLYTFNLAVEEDLLLGLSKVKKSKVSIYPNPTSDIVIIEGVDVVLISVYDTNGKQVLTSTSSSLDMSGLVDGVYTLQIESEEGIVTSSIEVR